MIYDLRINSNGKAEPMNDGFFKHCDSLVSAYKEEEYMTIGKYRVSRADWEVPTRRKELEKYLKRQGEVTE